MKAFTTTAEFEAMMAEKVRRADALTSRIESCAADLMTLVKERGALFQDIEQARRAAIEALCGSITGPRQTNAPEGFDEVLRYGAFR